MFRWGGFHTKCQGGTWYGAFGDFKVPSKKALDRGGDVKEDSAGMGRENLTRGQGSSHHSGS